MDKIIVKRDTQAWRIQTWVSFGLSFAICAIGIWNLDGQGLERALTTVCFFFLLFATFTLSKTIRDNQNDQIDTQAWIMMNWLGFGIAFALTAWSLFRMPIDTWQKGYLVGGGLFLLSSAFTLAKTMRDAMEADMLEKDSILNKTVSSKPTEQFKLGEGKPSVLEDTDFSVNKEKIPTR